MGKKRTHKEYVEELKVKNPNVEVVGKYINAKTKILHKCLIHNIEWEISPDSALRGDGCYKCCKEKIGNKNRKSHDTYINLLLDMDLPIFTIEKYIDSKTPILHCCKICGHEWRARPSNILSGHGCPKCAGNVKMTQELYVDEVKLKNPNIEVIDEYISLDTPILHRCKKHNITWMAYPYNILEGCGCFKCGSDKIKNALIKSHDEYVEDVYRLNPSIDVVGEYAGNRIKILHHCKIHNVDWMAYPYNILEGRGCYKCRGDKISIKLKKDTLWYIDKLYTIRPMLELVDEYIDYETPIYHRCKIDRFMWKISPHHALGGVNCPRCGGYSGEKAISEWLNRNEIDYIPQYRFGDCKDIKPLPFDFYLPKQNIIIEYDGRQHFIPVDFAGKGREWAENQLKITQYHDQIKNIYCQSHNINLLRIRYDDNIVEKLSSFIN